MNPADPSTDRDRLTEPVGTLWLRAPDWRTIDTVARKSEPWVLWRMGFQSLLAHWMDEAVRRNVARVEIICPDRAAEIEAALEGGLYWSREIRFHATKPAEAPPDSEIITMTGLPGLLPANEPADGTALLQLWLSQQLAWLEQRSPAVSVERQLHPRVWVGPGVRIHPSARLTGPCWIGARAEIGADAEIGPQAIIGHQSVIDQRASVTHSIVMPETFVGSRLHLQRMIADGYILLDANRGTRVEFTDRFMLARMRTDWRGFFDKWKRRLST
ncbi:MAG: hypothetical protein R3F03_03225 [Opitutaceae bacterium]